MAGACGAAEGGKQSAAGRGPWVELSARIIRGSNGKCADWGGRLWGLRGMGRRMSDSILSLPDRCGLVVVELIIVVVKVQDVRFWDVICNQKAPKSVLKQRKADIKSDELDHKTSVMLHNLSHSPICHSGNVRVSQFVISNHHGTLSPCSR